MVKVFTVMYILCSIYTTNPDLLNSGLSSPDLSNPDYTREISSQLLEGNLKVALAPNLPPTPAPTQSPQLPESSDSPSVDETNYLEWLKTLGFYKGDDSEDTALNRRNAVIRFQSACNMAVDGKFGPKSLSALQNVVKEGKLVYLDTIKEPSSKGKWIVVNKSKRILTFYEDAAVLKKYPVAVGNPISLTPSGKYTIFSKVINPQWGGGGYAKPVKGGSPDNPLGYRWMGLSYKDGDELGIHGNNSPYSIGRSISHGCLRMINSDVEEFFTKVPRSAPVWIGTEKELMEWGISQEEYRPAKA